MLIQAGTVVVSRVTSFEATWSVLLLLLGIHLSMNYAAVKCVRMRTLNRQRANIVISHLADTGAVLSLDEVAEKERIFDRDGRLRWGQNLSLGWAAIGTTLEHLLRCMSYTHNSSTGSYAETDADFGMLRDLFKDHSYLFWYDNRTSTAAIILKLGATSKDQLTAWAHALVLAKMHHSSTREDLADRTHSWTLLRASTTEVARLLDTRLHSLAAANFDLDTAALETRLGSRLDI